MRIIENKKPLFDIPCDTTITGYCEKHNTLQECMKNCNPKEDNNCYWGYYDIKTGKCMNVRYDVYRNLNPYYIIHDNKNTTFFIDDTKFESPPLRKNLIHIYDTVLLYNVNADIFLKPRIMFISPRPFIKRPSNYIPLQMDEPILLYDKYEDRILSPQVTKLQWVKSLKFLYDQFEEFFLEPIEDEDDNATKLTYDKLYYIKTSFNGYLQFIPSLFEQKVKEGYLDNLTLSIRKNKYCIFRLKYETLEF